MREEGLDYHEIAEALQLSVGSVGTTLARARRRLAETFDTMQRDADARQAQRGGYAGA
jgi:RNA polymerase sigma-70 factor (ECF subfamily)